MNAPAFHDGTIEGSLRFSRTRTLKNRLRIDCERAEIELRAGQFYRSISSHTATRFPLDAITFRPTGRMSATRQDSASIGVRCDAFLDTVEGRPSLLSTGQTALATVRVIEECYKRRTADIEP